LWIAAARRRTKDNCRQASHARQPSAAPAGSEFSRIIVVDFKADADFDQDRSCPCHGAISSHSSGQTDYRAHKDVTQARRAASQQPRKHRRVYFRARAMGPIPANGPVSGPAGRHPCIRLLGPAGQIRARVRERPALPIGRWMLLVIQRLLPVGRRLARLRFGVERRSVRQRFPA
jgi:hypothetical protein